MNPVAFTYDWGLVTDLARRNQARLCGKLGVEHILRSADIPTKRRCVRKNVQAWLKKPELGMVTLFTAGDKQFYKYARELRRETGIKLVIFCTGNMIEDTPYKTGLCGIREKDHGMTLTVCTSGTSTGCSGTTQELPEEPGLLERVAVGHARRLLPDVRGQGRLPVPLPLLEVGRAHDRRHDPARVRLGSGDRYEHDLAHR
jgi:hypothetical protein